MAEKFTQFDYLLNALEAAAQTDAPAEHGYGEKRRKLYQHVRELERKAANYDAAAGNSRPAMQQALEALEYHQAQTRPIDKTTEAIATVRAALTVPATLKTWQHDETGRITEASECPGRRWAEVPAGVSRSLPPLPPAPAMDLSQFAAGERAVSIRACENYARLYAQAALRADGVSGLDAQTKPPAGTDAQEGLK